MKRYECDVIYDVCGTLYLSNTTFDYCKWICRSKLWRLILKFMSTKIGRAINLVLNRLFNIELSRRLHLLVLRGKGKEYLYQQAVIFVDNFLCDKKIEYTFNLLNVDKLNGNKIFLVSASIDPVICAIANHINVEFLSSQLRYVNNICQGYLEQDLLGCKSTLSFSHVNKVVTDNTTDIELCLMADVAVIILNDRNKNFWIRNKSKHMRFYEI